MSSLDVKRVYLLNRITMNVDEFVLYPSATFLIVSPEEICVSSSPTLTTLRNGRQRSSTMEREICYSKCVSYTVLLAF
jgi:hypothetical protein